MSGPGPSRATSARPARGWEGGGGARETPPPAPAHALARGRLRVPGEGGRGGRAPSRAETVPDGRAGPGRAGPRTPIGILRNCSAGFKSPIQSPRACQSEGSNKEALKHEVEELKKKDLALDQEIAQLLAEGYSLEELEKHISRLHEYNDIKDTGQMLLGKLAMIRGITTKELYPKFDLELTD